jgi:hypothetical protein
MILEGTSADKMREIYTRPHRNSIYEPATIHDIPFEVLRKSFLHLLKQAGSDLASPSLACRAWRVVALDLMNSRKRFVDGKGRTESFVCGLHLRSIVGLESYTIKHLIFDLEFVGIDYILMMSRVVALTLSSLILCFIDQDDHQSSVCYDVLGEFLSQCDGIRNLRLEYFDFGDDLTAISQTVKDGLSRLKQFDMLYCQGDIRMFVENAPIPNLKILYYVSDREAAEEEEIISSLATNYRTLVSVNLNANFDSSASLLKIVECCRDLSSVIFGDSGSSLMLKRSDILAVASLPRLKSLDIGGCYFRDDALSALVRCIGLKELRANPIVDPAILAAIGMNFVWLNLWRPSKEVVDGIVEHCPNLQYLEMKEVDEEVTDGMVGSLKNGLMKMAKLKVNGKSIRLGTGWEGYPE